jgi:hypothetical protein
VPLDALLRRCWPTRELEVRPNIVCDSALGLRRTLQFLPHIPVVVCDMVEKEGQQTVQEIEAKHGPDRAYFHQIDVSKEAQGQRLLSFS